MLRDVEIVLDKPRNLRFTVQALLDLQRISKEPLGLFEVRFGQVSIEHLVWAIWAGLRHQFPSITIEEIVPLVEKYLTQGGTVTQLALEVNKALFHSGLFDEPKGATEGNAPTPAATPATGSPSTSLPG